MDIRLPGIQGPEAASQIKRIANHTGKSIPVIAVSAAIFRGDIEKFRESGMDDFISKPFDEETMIKMIKRLINLSLNDSSGELVKQEVVIDSEKQEGSGPVPEYDLGPLRESSEGNEAFFRDMVNLFLKDTENGFKQLHEHIKLRDWEAVSEVAHKISSPCRHLKAVRLIALLKHLENIMNIPGGIQSAAESEMLAKKEFERIREDIRLRNDI
jgi:CheY-like chemotaxis protein/HPt (histidine-containing phosphotransfer) domain-containing protein